MEQRNSGGDVTVTPATLPTTVALLLVSVVASGPGPTLRPFTGVTSQLDDDVILRPFTTVTPPPPATSTPRP